MFTYLRARLCPRQLMNPIVVHPRWLLWQLSACYAVKYAVDWQRELINAFVLDDTTAAPHGGHEEEDEVRGQAVARRLPI
jgi:hypothetical protein